MEISESKALLRKELLNKRKDLPNQVLSAGSHSICLNLQTLPFFAQAETVMGYLAMPGEPNLDALLLALIQAGKTVCVPLMGAIYGVMEAAAITGFEDLISGRLGVRMPDPSHSRIVSAAEIDLVLTPGVAFDISGGRLGMGAGYYDRFLARATEARRLGITWSMQLVDRVPREEHDFLMHWVVTEEAVICCNA